MPTTPIPPGLDQGALVIRYAVHISGHLGAGVAERIFGRGLDLPGPAPSLEPAFSLVTFGRWARDPDFDPAGTPERTWNRLKQRLQPLHVDLLGPADGPARGVEVPPEQVETLCLLVPSENIYRSPGEAWVALLRLASDDGRCAYHQLSVQHLGPDTYSSRNPANHLLADRHVVLVGAGALGGQIALDLARTGVGHLVLVDGDVVDVATASRQYAPALAAGRAKVDALVGHLRWARPDIHLVGLDLHIGKGAEFDSRRTTRRRLNDLLGTADLVIDATAAPAVTRYLDAVCHAYQKPFLQVSATAGAWGGCVFLATRDTGCWACLEHHRCDRTVPVPPADPAGLITPIGCAAPTFTGTSPDLATIAQHGSRVAIAHLTCQGTLGGDLHVAYLRTPEGDPHPVCWQSVPIPVHPQCPLHAGAGQARTRGTTECTTEPASDAATPAVRPCTVTEQPCPF
jgi:molybdopterin/thiamine biosynthesis adenylyltransferase